MTRTAAIEAELRARLARLTHRAGSIGADLRVTHDDDAEERAVERENDDVLEQLDDVTRTEVAAIRHTLERIERGQYGICEACHQPIAAVRLKAVPTAARCAAC